MEIVIDGLDRGASCDGYDVLVVWAAVPVAWYRRKKSTAGGELRWEARQTHFGLHDVQAALIVVLVIMRILVF
jgi:hypothetical protein